MHKSVLAVAATAMIGVAAPADAISLRIDYESTTFTLADQATGDQDGLAGVVEYIEGEPNNNSFPDFDILNVIGQDCIFCPTRILGESVIALATGSTADTDLIIQISETGYTLDDTVGWETRAAFTSNDGGNPAGTYVFNAYWDATDTLFGTSSLVASATLTDTDADVVFNSIPAVDTSSPFSLTLEFIVSKDTLNSLRSTADLDANLNVAPVPLPAGVLLLASGLGGLAVMARRRRNTVA